MPGGLLNLVALGNQNVYLNGNPTKTFFKTTYSKYTNFGMQKFRIDFEGSRNLKLTEDSVFNFKIPRYADLLMDTYIAVNLPNIWSPIFPPNENSKQWVPYEFKWRIILMSINKRSRDYMFWCFTSKIFRLLFNEYGR